MNLVDLIVIILLILGALRGLRKGLINSLVGLVGNLAGLLIALKYYGILMNWLEKNFQLVEHISTFFNKNLALPLSVSNIKLGTESVTGISGYLDKFQLPDRFKTQVGDYVMELGDKLALSVGLNLADVLHMFLAELVVKAIAIMLIWAVVSRVILIISSLLTKLTDFTLLGPLNKAGGIFTETLITAIKLTIFIGLISPLFDVAKLTNPTFFAAIIKTINEAESIPCFTAAFSFLTDNIFTFLT